MEHRARYLRSAFVRWEALRPVYNLAIFGVLGGTLVYFRGLGRGWPGKDFFIAGLFVLIVLNAVYCLGPVVEGALCLFTRVRMGRARYVLWGLMTLLPICKFVWLWRLLTFYFMVTIW